jgi:ubiquinone/menaquinone biosynthesis C-methylase UbiE
MSDVSIPVDVDVLREEIRKTYTDVSTDQDKDYIFPTGRAIGIDMTSSMLARARESATAMGLDTVELYESLIEELPLADASVDVVISNGVIDLVPDKDAVFDEIDRVLKPGGRLQVADVVIHHEVSEDARKRIDLWTG